MKKEDLASLLQLTGVDEKAVMLAINAYEIGYEEAKHESLRQSSIFQGDKKSENKEAGTRGST